jgi:hypothetical protein
VFDDVGYLDESLTASFDFEFWLRVFKKHQDRIGYLPHIQACSRLHADTKTSLLRQNVALESMRVLARHLGAAPAVWLLTYIDELFERYPHLRTPADAVQHCRELVAEARPYMSDSEARSLQVRLDRDARLRLALPDAFATIYPDGWMPPTGFLRIRCKERQWKRLRLECRHAPLHPRRLNVVLYTPWGMQHAIEITEPGPFEISINLPDADALPAYWSFIVRSENCFVPSQETDSADTRELAFLVERLELLD